MTRPASPGDRCFVIRDTEHAGRNLGKTCTVLAQCRCEPTDWKIETLEPWWVYLDLGLLELHTQCAAGECLCVPKSHLRPISDPNLETDDVSRLSPTDIRHPHPA